MGSAFASGKHAVAECDRCGQRFMLKELKEEVVKLKRVNIMVCAACWDPDHPQLQVGMYPVNDPQALRNPRPMLNVAESRDITWGWNPLMGCSATAVVGTVTVTVT